MTKKHFELVARVIKGMPDFAASLRTQKESCARAFAVEFAKENPRFDSARFLAACGVK